MAECVHKAAKEQRATERANEKKYIERFKSEGATVYELTESEKKAFANDCKPVYDWMREKVGDEIVEKWLKTAK